MFAHKVSVAAAIAILAAGCSSSGNDTTPDIRQKGWTPAGLQETKAVAAKIAAAYPGNCSSATPNDFSMFPISMNRFKSKVVPTGQLLCDFGEEQLEISAFASKQDRDDYVDDRATGICEAATRKAKEIKKPLVFPGTRWVVGEGNISIQPDSESVSRKVSKVTKGVYTARQCAQGISIDWDTKAVALADAIGIKLKAADKGCDSIEYFEREAFMRTRQLTNAQLPIAVASCTFDGKAIDIVTYATKTDEVEKFVANRTKSVCGSDPTLARIDGANFAILATGVIAEPIADLTNGTYPDSSCTRAPTTTAAP